MKRNGNTSVREALIGSNILYGRVGLARSITSHVLMSLMGRVRRHTMRMVLIILRMRYLKVILRGRAWENIFRRLIIMIWNILLPMIRICLYW